MGTKASSSDEWIELFNPSSSQVDITNWHLNGVSGGTNTFSIALSGFIPAGGFFVLARNAQVFQNVTIDQTSTSLSLLNSGEALQLLDTTSAVIDTANNSGGSWPAGIGSPNYASMERIGVVPDSPTAWATYAGTAATGILDSGGNQVLGTPGKANWATTVTVTPSPTNTSSPTATSSPTMTSTPCSTTYGYHSVLINEVGWMGTKASASDEWVELYNPSSCAIDLTNGWSLVGINSYYYTSTSYNFAISFPADSKTGAHIIINPNGYLVIAADANVFQASSITFTPFVPDSNTTPWTLANNYESLKLVSPSSTTVDTANAYATSYYGNYYWPAGTSSPNYASMERYHNLDDGPGGWVTYANPNTPSTGPKDSKGNLIQGTPGGPNWAYNVATITPSPMPTATKKIKTPTPFPPTPAPKLAINEFLPRAGHDWNNDGQINVYDEFIEIENVGVINVSLSGWSLSDDPNIGGKRYSLPAQTIKPGQRMVFYGSTTGILLIDSGDSVRLTNSRGVIVDARTYGPVEAADQSYCRIPDGIGYWTHPCFPTPGNENALTGVAPVQPTSIAIEPTPCLLADTVPGPFVQAICDAFGADVWNQNYWNQLAGQSDFPVQDNYSKWQTTVR